MNDKKKNCPACDDRKNVDETPVTLNTNPEFEQRTQKQLERDKKNKSD